MLEELENLPDPDVIATDIVEDLEAASEQFPGIANDLTVEETDEMPSTSEVMKRTAGD